MEENFNSVENMDLDIEKEETESFWDKIRSKIPFKIPDIHLSKRTLIIIGTGIVVLILLIIIIAAASSGGNKNKKNENSDSDKDKKAENTCEIGVEEKCLTCKEDKCASCNLKYSLEDGKCEPTFSFRGTYISDNDNEYGELLNYTFSDYITEMEVDGKKVTPSTNFLFEKNGEHIIYMTINTEKLTSLDKMFYQMRKLKSIYFSKIFDTKNINSMERIFVSCSQLTSIDISNFNTENVKSFDYLFSNDKVLTTVKLPKSKASKLERADHMFEGCSQLISIDFSNFIIDSKYLTSLHSTFMDCQSLTFLNLSNFNVQEVIDMEEIFEDCYALTSIDFSNFKTTKLQQMKEMFYRCNSLKSLDFTSFNTENVKNMEYLFYGCSLLTSIELSKFNTKNVELMDSMFNGCYSLSSLDLSGFNTEKVTKMTQMFAFCRNLQYLDISHFSDNNQNEYFDFFSSLPNEGKIILNKNFYEKIKNYIPSNWNKQFID